MKINISFLKSLFFISSENELIKNPGAYCGIRRRGGALRFIFLIILLSLISFVLQAVEIQGYVRSVNYEGHSFSVDTPPLQRVWVFPTTNFDSGTGYKGFKSIKEKDYVSVNGSLQKNGLLSAKTVKLIKPTQNSKNKSELYIDLNQSFTLEIKQKAKINGENLNLKVIEMIDTLCKEGLNCAGEGGVGIRILISNNKEKKDILLLSPGGRKPAKPIQVEALGYRVELIEIGEFSAVLSVRK